MSNLAKGTFDVQLAPATSELDGAVTRFNMTKIFSGDQRGSGLGLMLSAGDPRTGSAGYVAIETVNGELHGAEGSFVLQQFGTLSSGSQRLEYEVVPGSGQGDLSGLTGTLALVIDEDGTHCYSLEYEL